MIQTNLDALSCEVAQHRLEMLAEEGGTRAARSAGSAFVAGRGTVACALFTRDGRLIAQTTGGQQHVSALRAMMPEVLKRYPAEEMRDGDAFLCNDPFRGGIHPTDLGGFAPIFYEGEVAFFCGLLMIVSDMGGVSSGGLPATATEVFHEGMVVPPVRLYDAGELNEPVMTLLMANSRVPDKLRTDIDAVVGAAVVVGRSMREIIARYGLDTLNAIIEKLIDHTEVLVRDGISRIPDGEYFGSYLAQEDGVGPAPSYEVKVRVKIDGSQCTFDFTGSADQAPGAINSSYSQSLSCVLFALRCYIDPDIAMNEGFYRPLEVVFPLGSIVNPRFPAACNLRFSAGQAMFDAINAALRPVFPDRSMAPSSCVASINASGRVAGTERMWATLDVLFGPSGGRTGADADDGMPFKIIGSAGYSGSIEAYETMFPMVYEHFGFEPDSAGPGKWRGGVAIYKDIRFLSDCLITLRAVDRTILHPLGVEGGGAGRSGGWTIDPRLTSEVKLPPKVTNYELKAGSLVRCSMPGGGGYGSPFERDPELVSRDVRAGLVSRAAAAADYGVVLSAAGAVDSAGTQALRETHSR